MGRALGPQKVPHPDGAPHGKSKPQQREQHSTDGDHGGVCINLYRACKWHCQCSTADKSHKSVALICTVPAHGLVSAQQQTKHNPVSNSITSCVSTVIDNAFAQLHLASYQMLLKGPKHAQQEQHIKLCPRSLS